VYLDYFDSNNCSTVASQTFKIEFHFCFTGSRMGNLCCSNASVTADRASPKSAPKVNGQLNSSSSTTVTITKTQPWPTSTGNGTTTTSVNRSTNNQQSTAVTKSTKNSSSSAVFQVRTVKTTATATSSSNGSARSGEDERDVHTDVYEQQQSDDKYGFPPVLEDFNLMDCDVDPTELEDLFADEK